MRDLLTYMYSYLGVEALKFFLWSIIAIICALFVLIVRKIKKWLQELNNKAVSLLPEEDWVKVHNLLKKLSDVLEDWF